MSEKVKSDFLVASQSYLSGAARLLDWYGTYDAYNRSANGQVADSKATFADWRIVGQDLCQAMMEFEASLQ